MLWDEELPRGNPSVPALPPSSQNHHRRKTEGLGCAITQKAASTAQYNEAQPVFGHLEGVDELCQLVPWLRKVWTLRAGDPQESKKNCPGSREQ